MHALSYALSMAQEADGCLTVVHVLADDVDAQMGIEPDDGSLAAFLRQREAKARRLLETAVPESAATYCKSEAVLLRGKPWKEILRVATERRAVADRHGGARTRSRRFHVLRIDHAARRSSGDLPGPDAPRKVTPGSCVELIRYRRRGQAAGFIVRERARRWLGRVCVYNRDQPTHPSARAVETGDRCADQRSPAARLRLARATRAAPVQHLYYLPDHSRRSQVQDARRRVSAAAASIVLYHLANSHLLTFRYQEQDLVQVALFLTVGAVTARLTTDSDRLRQLASTDDLTGLHNLRSFEVRLAAMVRASRQDVLP